MFKNLIVYRIAQGWAPDLQAAEEALAKAPFMECGATQEKSCGWVPPRGEAHGALVESIGGQWIARLMTETKAIPASVLTRKVKEKAERIEKETGRKPGKKESRELKDEAKLDLLPMAFTKQASMWVWIDPTNRLLVLDTGSQSRADEVVTLLVEALPGLSVSLVHTQTSPQAAMAHADALAEIAAIRAENVELRAQLESIGAGGVSGPLMGKPQAMPDLSALTERGAKAWAGVDVQGLREGFTAADMATAAAQGFRDGVASVAANAGSEPVARADSWTNDQWIDLAQRHANADWDSDTPDGYLNAVKALCNDFAAANPSPPEGMVGGWMPIETAPRDGSEVLANTAGLGRIVVYWDDDESQWGTGLGYLHRDAPTHWMPLPPPPTTSAGSGKGERE